MRQQDCTCARSKYGLCCGKLSQGLREFFHFEEFEHSCALTAGNDQAIARLKLRGGADFSCIRTGFLYGFPMCFKIALKGEHADCLHLVDLPAARLKELFRRQLRNVEPAHGLAKLLASFE